MDIYKIDWTDSAEKDMRGIRQYMARQSSYSWARMYEKSIRLTVNGKVSSMPQKYRLFDDPLVAAMGFRRMNVRPYAVFFSINEAGKIVNVERVIHSKRDLTRVLLGSGG